MTEKKLKREFEFTLQNQISLHKGGERVFANKILLKAPSMIEMRYRCIIKQTVLESLQKQNEKTQKTGDTDSKNDTSDDMSSTSGDQFISVIYMNQDKDTLEELINAFTDILLSSATINSEKLTDTLIKQIDCGELDAMLGEYIINFILPSWMKRAMNT